MYSQQEIIKKASILIDKKKYKEAKSNLLEFLKESKNIKIDARIYYFLYLSFDSLKDNKNAKKNLEKCLKINKNNHIALNNLANIYFKEGNILRAEKFYLNSIKNKPDYLIAIVNTAIFFQNIGKLEEAKKFYLKAVNLAPKQISIYFNLSRIDKDFMNKDKIKYLSELMRNEKIDLLNMAYGFFLLAEQERKENSYIKEMEYLKKAHQYTFNEKFDKNKRTLNYWQNIIPKQYNKFSFINENTKNELSNLKPIFIVGLPRSGSTIAEAILSSGEMVVENLGETSIFNGVIVTTHNELQKKENSKIDLDLINKKVLVSMKDKNFINKGSKIFTDKSLENFFYIEIILKIFPHAKFINTFRNIEDNIFAIFQQSLSKLSWTHTIENILEYIDNYLKIIEYFIKKYPNRILSLDLKELTNKPEETSKKLYSFCNLKWSKKVLDFYNRKDLLVSTASNIQIRKKINSYDEEKYKPYKDLLKKFSNKYDWIN
jgi:tetratricopeptide (TPR) repeat protein